MEQILTIKEPNLKRCPFCGDTNISISYKYDGGKYFVNHGYSVGCQSIGCFGCHSYARTFETKEKAIESWNKRSD